MSTSSYLDRLRELFKFSVTLTPRDAIPEKPASSEDIPLSALIGFVMMHGHSEFIKSRKYIDEDYDSICARVEGKNR